MTLLEHTPVLLGPADADNYRTTVGRYKERWYHDPLPGCELAEASDWVGPSVSATKPPFSNKYVPMRAIADMPSGEWARLSTKDADERYEAIKIAEKIGARLNMDRGSIVHRYAEDRLLGRATFEQFLPGTPKALEQAKRFLPALNAFFDAYQPELVVCEAVCLHRTLNGVGYGGTTDAIVRIEGELWDVDWKSRNSDHAAYAEEAAQGGAYIGAEYMIVAGPDGNPKRIPVPPVAGVLIVSIREDGYRAYPIDRDGAVAHYQAMHRWWCAQQDLTANKVIGRPWAARASKEQECQTTTPTNGGGSSPLDSPKSPTPANGSSTPRPTTSSPPSTTLPTTPAQQPTPSESTPDPRRQALLARYRAMSDDEKLAFTALGIDKNDLDAVEAGLDKVDRFNVVVPFVKPEPPVHRCANPTIPEGECDGSCTYEAPDEGGPVEVADVLALSVRYEHLSPQAKAWTGALIAQGNKAYGWRIKDKATVRRYELYRGVLGLAEMLDGGTN